ncbi:hypothetical protein G3M48_004663 [Beauveria asiatica]|uniref:Copper-fist domain-containing protein n=1 Tax=Beauveria asiatica TaxID=1069075 RepID=A0AAW0RTF3_9HYPO
MIIDGETYACEGCIRGHRTRNCQHSGKLPSRSDNRAIANANDHHHLDRPLQHIKAKGRPVSQCNHCRSERKNRSAHVKCQCGKRASEGGSGKQALYHGLDGGISANGTRKTQAPTQLGDISETLSDLASPASTLNTASPAQLSTSGDFQWSDAATPVSNFTSLDGLAQFDPNSWLNTPQLDAAAAFGGSVVDHSSALATQPTTGVETGFQSTNYQPHFPMDMPDFTNVNDWPALDDESAKQFLAMMDHPAGMDLTGLDASAPNTAGGFNIGPTFDMDFSSLDQQQASAQPIPEAANGGTCNSKREGGCGPCCG